MLLASSFSFRGDDEDGLIIMRKDKEVTGNDNPAVVTTIKVATAFQYQAAETKRIAFN